MRTPYVWQTPEFIRPSRAPFYNYPVRPSRISSAPVGLLALRLSSFRVLRRAPCSARRCHTATLACRASLAAPRPAEAAAGTCGHAACTCPQSLARGSSSARAPAPEDSVPGGGCHVCGGQVGALTPFGEQTMVYARALAKSGRVDPLAISAACAPLARSAPPRGLQWPSRLLPVPAARRGPWITRACGYGGTTPVRTAG